MRRAIGHQLAELRRAAGLTQSQACAQIHRRKSWLAKIERGQRSLLFSEAVELARVFNVTVGALWPHDAAESGRLTRTDV